MSGNPKKRYVPTTSVTLKSEYDSSENENEQVEEDLRRKNNRAKQQKDISRMSNTDSDNNTRANENFKIFESHIRDTNSSNAAGRFHNNQIVVDEIEADFQSQAPATLTEKRPPYVPEISEDTLIKIHDYITARQQVTDTIQGDPLVDFYTLVAGFTGSSYDHVVGNDTRPRGTVGSDFGIRGSQRGARERSESPSIIKKILTSPDAKKLASIVVSNTPVIPKSTSTAVTDIPGQISPPHSPTAHEPILDPRTVQRTQGLPFTVKEQSLLALYNDEVTRPGLLDYLQRQDIKNNLSWIDRPEITGRVNILPSVYANTRLCHTMISRYPQFEGAQLIDFCTKEPMMTRFAYWVANRVNQTNAMGVIKPTLDRTPGRLKVEEAAWLRLVTELLWDQEEQEFVYAEQTPTLQSRRTYSSYRRKYLD